MKTFHISLSPEFHLVSISPLCRQSAIFNHRFPINLLLSATLEQKLLLQSKKTDLTCQIKIFFQVFYIEFQSIERSGIYDSYFFVQLIHDNNRIIYGKIFLLGSDGCLDDEFPRTKTDISPLISARLINCRYRPDCFHVFIMLLDD